MEQPTWYEDIVSNINPKITIPYLFDKDLAQNNVTGIAHKIQYGDVLFQVLLGNPIFMTDNTQHGTIIIYPIYELTKRNGQNRKIGIYEVILEDLPKIYDDVRHNEPNIEMLGRPYFYNFILIENNLPQNRLNPILRDNEMKYGRGFNWNKKNKIKMSKFNIDNIVNDKVRLDKRAQLEKASNDKREQLQREEIEQQKASNERREQKKRDILEQTRLKQLHKLDTQRTLRGAKTQRNMKFKDDDDNDDNDNPETVGITGIVNNIGKNFFNRTRKKKNIYVYDESHNWLQKYMKNISYQVIDNEDVTMFGALSKLLDESSQDIREKLVNFVTIDDFMKQREMHEKLVANIKKQHEKNKPNREIIKKLTDALRDYEYLINVNTFDSFKSALRSIKGNMHLLTVIERMYENKYKILVLKNNQRTNKQRESKFEKIVLCNNNTLDPEIKTIKKHMQYGLISLDNGKYNAINYDKKGLIHYSDVPSAIQKRLIDNCINA